jgi:nucleobase:cation symporter-1, NCS1 family
MSETSITSSALKEGALPLLPGERTWGGFALFGNCACAAVATWCFIIGGYLSFYLPAVQGTIVLIVGQLIGVFFVFLACVPTGTRYGLEGVRSSRPQLGVRGSYLSLALLVVFTLGWNTLLVIFCGRAGAAILIGGRLLPESARSVTEVAVGLAALVVVWFLLRGGPDSLRNAGPIIAISVIVLAVFIIGLIVAKFGWSAIIHAKPTAPSGDRLLDYVIPIELMIASGLSWWPYVGGMVRLSQSARRSILPVVLGLGVAVSVVCVTGLFSGLAVPESGGDPTTYLIELGGLAFGIPTLAFIMLANVGTTMVGAYVSALALKQQSAIDRRLPWNAATTIALGATAVVLIFLATPFFDHFGTFLAFSGVLLGPLCGIQIADYFFIRKQTLDIRSLYSNEHPSNAYWFTGGFNIVGLVSMAAGVGTYFALLDPITFESSPVFKYTTASVPATLVAMATYVVLMKMFGGRTNTSQPRTAMSPPQA